MKVYGIARSQRLQIDECRIPAAGFPFAASRKTSVLSNLSRLTPTKDHHANPQRPSCVLSRRRYPRPACNLRRPHRLLPQTPPPHPPPPPNPHPHPHTPHPPPPPPPTTPLSHRPDP